MEKLLILSGGAMQGINFPRQFLKFISKIVKGIFKVGVIHLPKTLYFNFKYLKLSQAIELPFFVSREVCLLKAGGGVSIVGNLRTGMIRIGFGDVGIFDKKKSRTLWQVSGKVIFNGSANIGHGSKISIGENGILEIGDNFAMTAESSIVCYKLIKFGSGCLVSWDVLIMDTDFHQIKDADNIVLNKNREICLGDKVWIGCRSLVLKGTRVGNSCVIGANSFLNKAFEGDHLLVGGNPARIIKKGIDWGGDCL